MQVQSQALVSRLSKHIYQEFLREMPLGRKIRIESVDQALAIELAGALRILVEAEGNEGPDAPVLIAVIDATTPDGNLRIDVPKAIESRNRLSRILYLDPESVGAMNGNLGVNAFDTRSLLEVYAGAIKSLKADVRLLEGGDEVLRAIARNIPAGCSVLSQAELLLDVLSSENIFHSLGKNLWRLGLIPDLGDEVMERLADNARVSDILSGRTRPLSTGNERLDAAGVTPGSFRNSVQTSLEPFPDNFSQWLENLSEEQSFHLWPISSEKVYDIEELAVKPFILPDGKVDPKCKLKKDETSGSLVAANKVSVYWSTNPTNLASVHTWQIDLAPPAEILDDFPVIRDFKVKHEKRMATLTWKLTEDDLDNIAPRYVVRISALDEFGQVLKLVDGNPAVVESQEFILDVEPGGDGGESTSSINAWSVPEGVLEKILGGRDSISETGPTWGKDKQDFSLSISAFEKIRIPISRFIIEAQSHAFANVEKSFWHSVSSPSGSEVSFAMATSKELELPPTVQKLRKNFLQIAASKNEARMSVEAMAWDEELRDLAEAYLVSFRKALEENQEPNNLRALLLHDTVSVTTSSPRGAVTGVVLLPTHPLRLCWVSEHDRLLREWMSGAAAAKSSAQRRSQVDMPLVRRITPANFPFLLLGGESIDTLRAFSYYEELTHGSSLYLDASSADFQLESIALRRVLDIPRTGSSGSDTSAALVGERMHRYRRAHMDSPGLRTLVLNSADAEVPAEAAKRLISRLGTEAAGMKLDFIGYGPMSSFANPMSHLTKLQREMSQVDEVSKDEERPQVSVISRELDEVANDSSEAHLALVQGVASLQVSPTQGPKGLSATLRGLLTPITSSKWEHEEQIGFFTKPALETKNTKKKSELVLGHAALLSSLSRYLFGSNNPAGLELQVDPSTLDRLRAAHSRADWVLTLDRNIGLSLYEDLVGDALGGAYVLDYAPDFIDGLGDRLTVTTTRKDELERVISGAMTKLGLKNEGIGAPELLRTLASVSGRLALRLLGDDTSAVEALGLAATISHLSQNGSLKDTVLIPVDAHLDIFGSHARRDEDSAERCDVLLLRLTQTSHSIEFLEVKARSGNIDAKLFKTMAFQVDQTHDLIKNRLFGNEQPRVDSELQWARWCSLLHFYADRAGLHGYIGEAKLMEIHSFIDRIEINKESPTVSKSGYIVSVQGKQADVPDSFESLKLHLLNATQFEDMGFTTEFREPSIEIETSSTSISGEASDSKPDSFPSVQPDESSKSFGASEEGSSDSTPESSAEIVDEGTTAPPTPDVESGAKDFLEPVLSDPDQLMEEIKPENEPEPQDPATIQTKVVVIQLGEEIM